MGSFDECTDGGVPTPTTKQTPIWQQPQMVVKAPQKKTKKTGGIPRPSPQEQKMCRKFHWQVVRWAIPFVTMN